MFFIGGLFLKKIIVSVSVVAKHPSKNVLIHDNQVISRHSLTLNFEEKIFKEKAVTSLRDLLLFFTFVKDERFSECLSSCVSREQCFHLPDQNIRYITSDNDALYTSAHIITPSGRNFWSKEPLFSKSGSLDSEKNILNLLK